MKIDLQIHTTHSDGYNPPAEIVELARKGGVSVLSVTDHDTLSGLDEVEENCKKADIKAISGVEISTTYRGRPLHVLGYNIDTNNEELLSFLKNINEHRKQKFIDQLQILNDNLQAAGRKAVDVKNYLDKDFKYYSYPGLALFMYEEGIIDTRNEGFNYFRGIKETTPPVEPAETFKILHRAGGKAVLSHPFAPKISLKEISSNRKDQEKMVHEFARQGLNGIECYQTGHDNDDVKFCLQMAEKYNLFITAGSDWHGSLEQVGEKIKKYLPHYLNKLGDLVVPKEVIPEIPRNLES